MADTRRTLSALQTLLADNVAGDISAQDVRDFLVSVYGGGILLEERIASASATLDFTTWYSSLYSSYLIELENVLNTTNTQDLLMQFSTDGGGTWETASNYYYGWTYAGNTGASAVVSTGGGSATSFTLANQVDNTFGGVSGEVRFKNPGGSAPRRSIQMNLTWGQATVHLNNIGAGTWPTATAINGLRFFYSSGNITSGTIRVYGRAK